jgi:hypothetical protein
LDHLVCGHNTGQALVRRARVVLLAAEGYSNVEMAHLVPMDEEAAGLWRRRWAALQCVPLDELGVAGAMTRHHPRLSPEQVCRIVGSGL